MESHSTLLTNLKVSLESRDDLRCPQCLHMYNRPRLLPSCLHTFCETCIRAHVADAISQNHGNITVVKCPTCEADIHDAPVRVKDVRQWSKKLPKNTAVLKSTMKEAITTEKQCSPCKHQHLRSTAVKICLDCNETYCKYCARVHQYSSASTHHKFKKISNKDRKYISPKLGTMPEDFQCPLHPEYRIEYYCESDKCLLCANCAIDIHTHCKSVRRLEELNKSVDVKEWTKDFKNDLVQLAARVNETADLAYSMNEEANSKAEVRDLKNEFDRIRKKILKMVEDNEKAMIKDAEKATESDIAKLDNVLKTGERLLKSINASYVLLEHIAESDCQSNSALYYEVLGRQIRNYRSAIETEQSKIGLTNFTIDYTRRMCAIVNKYPPLGVLRCNFEEVPFSAMSLSSSSCGLDHVMRKLIPASTKSSVADVVKTDPKSATSISSVAEIVQSKPTAAISTSPVSETISLKATSPISILPFAEIGKSKPTPAISTSPVTGSLKSKPTPVISTSPVIRKRHAAASTEDHPLAKRQLSNLGRTSEAMPSKVLND